MSTERELAYRELWHTGDIGEDVGWDRGEDGNRAVNRSTGQQAVWDTASGTWKDAKTGESLTKPFEHGSGR